MNNIRENSGSLIYYRLIALWVLCEAMVGGIIHGFKIPISGLVVGSCAVICICLIAWYVPGKGSIIRATIIVAIFKMVLSPQAPPTAYIAVFFQGLLGELLFWNRRTYRISCLILAVLALLESGFQRIFVLTIVYGNDFWKAINDFLNRLTGQKNVTNYSLVIGGAYVVLHLITGLIVGWWASLLPGKIVQWSKDNRLKIAISNVEGTEYLIPKRKRGRFWLFIVWIILIALYVQSYFKIGEPLLPTHVSLKILLRSLIIVLAWVFMIGPEIKNLLHTWLQKKRAGVQPEMQKVFALLPETQLLMAESWKRTKSRRGLKRLQDFARTVIFNALREQQSLHEVYVLTGPIQTGKTTSLLKWTENRNDVYGIVTPIINGKRVFVDVRTGEQFQMELLEELTDNTVSVGKFVFNKTSFDKAINIIRKSIPERGWLVVDEIGPLELKGEGFSAVLKEILQSRRGKTLLVVRDRDGVVSSVKEYFNMHDAVIIHSVNELND